MALKKWKEGWDWAASLYEVDEDNNIIEELAQAVSFRLGYAAYKEAIQHRAWAIIQLREKSRIVRTAKTGGYDSETKTVELIWEKPPSPK